MNYVYPKSLRSTLLCLPLIVASICFSLSADAQFCGTATNNGVLTPTTTPQNAAAASGNRRYWTFSATAGSIYNFNTCGTTGLPALQNTVLRLYDAPGGGNLLVTADDQCGIALSNLTWTCPATGTYSIHLSRSSCNTLNQSSVLTYSVIIPPANDECSAAIALTPSAAGASCSPTAGTSVNATQSLAPNTCSTFLSSAANDVWYRFTATATSHKITVTGSGGFDAIVNIRSDACNGTHMDCVDATTGNGTENLLQSGLDIGTEYYVRVYGWNGGTGTFNICVGTPPANDDCANAITIPGAGPFPHLTAVVNNSMAGNTGQPTPSCQGNSNGSIWYNFTPTCSGNYRFSTCPADAPASGAIDHVLVVATGSCGGSFTEIACSDDAGAGLCSSTTSSVIPSVALTAGTTYRVIAYTWNTVRGNIQIQTRMVAPAITSLSASSGCGGTSLTITGTNLNCATAVTIGGTPATITSNTGTSITVTIGNGTTGTVNVTTPGGSANSPGSFTVNSAPAATFTPVDNCANNQFSVQVNVTSTGTGGNANLLYTVNGSPFSVPNLGLGITTIGPFAAGSEVIANMINGICAGPQSFLYSGCAQIIPCGTTVVVNHCYRNNDTRTFLFTSSNANETLTLGFVSGSIAAGDVVTFHDGTDNLAPIINGNGYTNTPLNGLILTSTGSSIFVEINSNSTNSCQTGQQTSWNMEVECTAGCQDPEGIASVFTNCPGYDFSIVVEVLSTGDISTGTTTLRYTVNGGSAVLIPGLVESDFQALGPFAIDDVVNIRLLHGDNPLCDNNLGNFSDDNSCPTAENCINALNLATQTSPLPGTTVGRTHEFTFACGTATANTAPDAIYFMDVPNGAEFNIRQQSNTYNSQHYVRYGGACPGTTVIACVNDDNGETGWVNWVNTTGSTQRVWWIQDGFGTATGSFVLEWQLLTCPIAPGLPMMNTSSYAICENGSVPGGQGLSASCSPIAQSESVSFPGENFVSEGTTLTTRATLVFPALPAGAVVTGARLKLFNVVAQTFFGFVNAQRQNIRVALSGAYTLAETQISTQTGAGLVTPDPVITLTGFPAAGGTINLRTRQTSDSPLDPDAIIASALIEVDYTVLPSVRWYTAPVNGTLVHTGTVFDPVGQGAVNSAVPGVTNFHATCGYGSCENIRLTGTFTVVAAPDAGTNGTLTICSNSAPVSLLDQLGTPDSGGAWSGPSTVVGGMYQPATMDPGSYMYTVSPTAPCSSPASATVSVTENTAQNWYADTDGDGFGNGPGTLACSAPNAGDVNNNTDNCPSVPNIDQANADGDALGDACDTCPNDATNDGDGDGVCEDVDNCPGLSNPNQANFDNDAQGDACDTDDDNDGLSDTDEATAGTNPFDPDTDDDSILDGDDGCPLITGEEGSVCDANPNPFAFTLGELNGSCNCVAAACTQNLVIEFQTDGNPGQIGWELREQGTNTMVQQGLPGSIAAPNGVQTVSTCVPNGCYSLKVTDSGGNGITNGGYILRTGTVIAGSLPANMRIIDNRRNFTSGGVSQMATPTPGDGDFCFNGSTANLTQGIYTSCDKLDWVTGEYFVCSAVPAVSSQWNAGNTPAEAISGYEFWIYNPNGGYSFRRFRSHNVSDNFAPDNATRACHMKINNWAAPNLIPANVLMNMRVRSRVNGTYHNWGAACRFMINPTQAACPLTNLMDIPGDENLSCNSTRAWGNGNYIHARPVSGATQYQWRFRLDGESFITIRTTTTYFIQLNWITLPLQDGKTYTVEVRAFKNGAWCVDAPTPANCGFVTPCWVAWNSNKPCLLTIDNTPFNGGGENFTAEEVSALHMYPNPNRGDQLYLSLDAIEEGVTTVSVDIIDLYGKRVSARTLAVTDGFINTVLDLGGDMANGMYMVNVTAGDKRFTERLVIQR